MAGSSGLLPNPNYDSDAPITGQWLVHYSRFFNFPSVNPTSSDLVPLASRCRKKKDPAGTWLSSASMVSLQLLQHHIEADGLLLVACQEKIYEQHRISKLHFSWPQVSCLEDCPPRGSRAVFANYEDSVGQVQKFAMRFFSSSDAQAFIGSLKTTFNGIRSGITSGRLGSERLSTTEFISSDGMSSSTSQHMSNPYPVGNYWPEMQIPSDHKQTRYTDETHSTHYSVAGAAPVPPSLNTLLPDNYNDGHRELLVPELFYPIHKSPEQGTVADRKFFGILTGLEIMLLELGGDLSL